MKIKPLLITVLMLLAVPCAVAQQPQTAPRSDSRAAQVEEMRNHLDTASAPDARRQRVSAINAAMDDLDKRQAAIEADRARLASEKLLLLQAIARDEAAGNFRSQISYTVVHIRNEDTVTLLIDGTEHDVSLAGLYGKMAFKDQATAFLKEATASGSVFARCTSETCASAFFYRYPTGESINAELVARDWATPSGGFFGSDKPDRPQPPSAGSTVDESSRTGSIVGRGGNSRSRSSGGSVEVRTYVKKDGTVVQGHTRKSPRN